MEETGQLVDVNIASEDHSTTTRIETEGREAQKSPVYVIQKYIPPEQGLKLRCCKIVQGKAKPHKDIPPE